MKLQLLFATILLLKASAFAGIRGPGPYQGVVLFDRWDGCYLYSAVYLMYIPEKLKESIRPEAGESVVLDATEVFQPINPGDGRLEKFMYVGPSPIDNTDHVERIHLAASLDLADPKHPVLKLVVTNHQAGPLALRLDELAFTILAKKPADADRRSFFITPADGPSYALQTRWPLYGISFPGKDTSHWQHEDANAERRFSWRVRNQDQTAQQAKLPSGAAREFVVDLSLGRGEYDLLCGYGGDVHASKAIASNLIAVDVTADGTATIPKVDGR